MFWFLLILSFSTFLPCLFFMPETLRTLAGTRSIPAKGINKTLWRVIGDLKGGKEVEPNEKKKRLMIGDGPKKAVNPVSRCSVGDAIRPRCLTGFVWYAQLNALPMFLEKDVFILLIYNAFTYAAFYAVVSLQHFIDAQTLTPLTSSVLIRLRVWPSRSKPDTASQQAKPAYACTPFVHPPLTCHSTYS